jgi:hypothetical protein
MHDDPIIILTLPPDLSDEAAYYFSEFFYGMAMSIENHYAPQLKSYWKKLECEASRQSDDKLTEEMPF